MSLAIGQLAPEFELVDHQSTKHKLSDYRGKNVILAFYPAAFTGVCQKQLCTMRDSMDTLNSASAQVFGISADIPFSNAVFAQQNNINYPLLSDYTLSTIQAYGLELPNFAGLEGLTRSHRGTVLINKEGVISYMEVTANPGLEPDYNALMNAVQSLA
ncbi:MAG: peroxiredoxin [Ignavibacteria bacterium]|jgi:peroxiredoxin|nr:peroxiredoxin [Ignavibacteria bacterium]